MKYQYQSFAGTFLLAAALFLLPAGLVLFLGRPAAPTDRTISQIEITESRPAGRVSSGDRRTLLAVVERPSGGMDSLLLMQFCPDSSTVKTALLPGELVCYGQEGPVLLQKAFARGGAEACRRLLAAQLQIPIHRRVTLPWEAQKELLERLGPVPVTLAKEVRVHTGELALSLPRGTLPLDALGLSAAWHGQALPERMELLETILTQKAEILFSRRREELFLLTVNHCETDLNRMDYETALPFAEHFLPCKMEALSVSTMQTPAGDALSIDAMRRLHEGFTVRQS